MCGSFKKYAVIVAFVCLIKLYPLVSAGLERKKNNGGLWCAEQKPTTVHQEKAE